MPRNDRAIPARTQKVIYQQAGSRCPFCAEADVALLDIHHIVPRSAGGSNDHTNLILACKNCHARIESGGISQEELNRKKLGLGAAIFEMPRRERGGTISVGGSISGSIVANNLTITGGAKVSGKMAYPAGSIGADVIMRGYISYLIGRYYEYRKADASYGSQRPFSHAEIHSTIKSRFKAGANFLPTNRFGALADYLKDRIDQTIQGKRNRSLGRPNYDAFEDYGREQNV